MSLLPLSIISIKCIENRIWLSIAQLIGYIWFQGHINLVKTAYFLLLGYINYKPVLVANFWRILSTHENMTKSQDWSWSDFSFPLIYWVCFKVPKFISLNPFAIKGQSPLSFSLCLFYHEEKCGLWDRYTTIKEITPWDYIRMVSSNTFSWYSKGGELRL